MTPTHDPFDRLRNQLGQAAFRQSTVAPGTLSPRKRWRPSMRPLGIAVIGVLATGSAAAAVLTNSTSTSDLSAAARPDAPAVQNLSSLNEVLDAISHRIPDGSPSSGSASAAPAPAAAHVLGTTVTRGAVSVDVTITANRICLAPGSPVRGARTSAGCAWLPLPADRLAFVQGTDAGQAWLAAAVPDGVKNVEVTADTGAVDTAIIDKNVAIAVLPGARAIAKLTWQRPDGTRQSQAVGEGPDNSTQAIARPLDP